MKYRKLMAVLGMLPVVGIPPYFIAAYFGWYPLVEHVPGYTVWFWSFPLPDFWLVVTSALMVYALIAKRDTMAVVCGLLTASAGIFMGLNELMFLFYTGMILFPLSDTGFDLAVKIYFFSVGAFYIRQFSREIRRSGV